MNHDSLRELFMLIKVKNNMFKRWLNISGWGIVEAMHDVVFQKTKYVIILHYFIFISAHEVNTINNGLVFMFM